MMNYKNAMKNIDEILTNFTAENPSANLKDRIVNKALSQETDGNKTTSLNGNIILNLFSNHRIYYKAVAMLCCGVFTFLYFSNGNFMETSKMQAQLTESERLEYIEVCLLD